MDAFDHVLNWRLKVGSHRFPGPDGGTCINEAALVAAGFPYQPICDVGQMPERFSRPICDLAMVLNDIAADEELQRLLHYVTRLACADTKKVEKARADYITQHVTTVYSVSFEEGLKVLEGALAIGRQADPLGRDEVLPRMEAARLEKAQPAKPTKPPVSKVKSWLAMKEAEPAA